MRSVTAPCFTVTCTIPSPASSVVSSPLTATTKSLESSLLMDQVGVSPGGGHTFEAVQTVTFTPLAVRSVTGDENLIVKFKGGVGRAVLGVAIGGPLTGGIGDVVGVFV